MRDLSDCSSWNTAVATSTLLGFLSGCQARRRSLNAFCRASFSGRSLRAANWRRAAARACSSSWLALSLPVDKEDARIVRAGESSCLPALGAALALECAPPPELCSGALCRSPPTSARWRACCSRCCASSRRRCSRCACCRRNSACMSSSLEANFCRSRWRVSSTICASSLNFRRTSASHSSCSFRRFRASSVSFCSLRISRLCCSSKRFSSRARLSRT
mmetsp:Transcript_13442/g.36964  ORF Transcript_13442/g.36964 Transcript_13442/m.36964 type:complete len:219 (-) Transcript_13442:118-774(-)